MAAASSAAFADEPARLGVAELVRRCEEIVSTYHAGRTTVDTHTDEYLSEHGIVEPEDVCFLQQVMYGCVRYRRLLKIMTSSLFFKHSGETQRSDATLYTVKLCIAAWRHGSSLTHSPAFGQVLGYLALLRLSELGFDDFKAIVLSQERHAMTVFLRFLFDADTLRVWLRPEWMKHYEPSFVEDELVGKALTFAPQVQGVVRVLEGQAAAEASKRDEEAAALKALAEGRGGKGECTVPEPFNLTAPKARLVPPPEETIPIGFKPTPVPPTTYVEPKRDREELERRKDQNRIELKAKYSDPKAAANPLTDQTPAHGLTTQTTVAAAGAALQAQDARAAVHL